MESNHISLTKEEIERANRLSDSNIPNNPDSPKRHFNKTQLPKDASGVEGSNKEIPPQLENRLNNQLKKLSSEGESPKADDFNLAVNDICLRQDNSTVLQVEPPEGEATEVNNQDPEVKDDQEQAKQDVEPEEEEEEEEKFENAVEAKDFQYFKRQCKFERFVNQLGTSKNRSKEQ